MLIEIHDKVTLRQVQEAFSKKFPYLEINFFSSSPNEENLYQKSDLIPVDKAIGNIRRTHVSALMEIRPSNTIADVEREFFLRFGLRAQVLRMYDTHWILPADTDQLTMKEQNEMAKKDAAHIVHPGCDSKIEDVL